MLVSQLPTIFSKQMMLLSDHLLSKNISQLKIYTYKVVEKWFGFLILPIYSDKQF